MRQPREKILLTDFTHLFTLSDFSENSTLNVIRLETSVLLLYCIKHLRL
jgi:hypothetical protein